MNRVAIIVVALGLASCGPAITCDSDGMIVIPDDVSTDTRVDWNSRNLRLATQRLNKATGSPDGRWLTPETLEKAKGCP